jgi:hypothetical protein
LGLIELLVVLMFIIGWGVLELVILRMDRRRRANDPSDSKQHSGHAEG